MDSVEFGGQVFRGRITQHWEREIEMFQDEEAALLNGDPVSDASSVASFELEEEHRPAADSCCKKVAKMAARSCVTLVDWAGTAVASSIGSAAGLFGAVIGFGGDLGALEEDGKNLLEKRLLLSIGVGAAAGTLAGRALPGRESSSVRAATAAAVGAFTAGVTFVSWMWAAPFSDEYY